MPLTEVQQARLSYLASEILHVLSGKAGNKEAHEPQFVAEKVAALVSPVFNLMNWRMIFTPTRERDVTDARHVAVHLTRMIDPSLGSNAVGRLFNRDHSTILNASKKVEYLSDNDPEFHEKYNKAKDRVLAFFNQ